MSTQPGPITRIYSAAQPTHKMHLGNYLGAIRNWVALQEIGLEKPLFCMADLHAITVPQNPAALRQNSREAAATYIACGVNPAKAIIYPQSALPQHSELGWILGTLTPLGWLNRMTQFKDKAGKQKDMAGLGLYAYPVLMAADILLFKATHVPVGEDQKQHLELARDIAGAFNRQYSQDFFPLPEPMILPQAARIMSLRDGSKKMSKSDESEYSRINLTDDADTIATKFRKAKSDSDGIPSDKDGLKERPELENLVTIYAALADIHIDAVLTQFGGQGFSAIKQGLAELAVVKLSPIAERLRHLLADSSEIDRILADSAAEAYGIADKYLSEIKDIVGFLRV